MTFLQRIDHHCDGLEITLGTLFCPECQRRDTWEGERCTACGYDQTMCGGEGGFSWSSCDTCGSSLGGQRYKATGWPDDEPMPFKEVDKAIDLDICVDCLVFFANGDLPEEDDDV